MAEARANYVGAYYSYDIDAVIVWERDENGRRPVAHHAPYYFYVPDENGEYKSIFNRKLKRIDCEDRDQFQQYLRGYNKYDVHESDIPPMFKVLMNMYHDLPTPIIHYAFLDIEVDYKSSQGFSSPENPYAPINAVTIYQSWTKRYFTYAVPPKGWKNTPEFEGQLDSLWKEHSLGFNRELVLCSNEEELLKCLVRDIQDADIISGWNSEFFDLPYIMKRLERIAPKLIDQMSFKGCKPPKESTIERFGATSIIYQLNGRTHLDYLDLFKKFTFEGRTSYSLANISADELDIPKLHYEGTLEQLYNRDFAHFIAYNARDVEVLVKLDDKFKFIALVNQMAHENTVPFAAMLGTVRYVETGIANRAHNVHQLIVADKRPARDKERPVEGALVLSPLVGLHDWLGSVDINSLYPSVIRSINISPEKYIGQFGGTDGDGWSDWRGILDMDDEQHTLVDDMNEVMTMTGAEWWKCLIDNGWVITPFGTVFDEGNGLGLVPEAIQFWYSERKILQAEKKKYTKLLKTETDPALKAEYKKLEEHYDLLQLTKKIQLNSTYGALLSPHFRFGRREMGGSVTACGRSITTQMIQWIGYLVTGKKCNVIKVEWGQGNSFIQRVWVNDEVSTPAERLKLLDAVGKIPTSHTNNSGTNAYTYETDTHVILLSDTDSCYFKTLASTKEEAIEVADTVAEAVNGMFPEFMRKVFNCQPKHDDLIKAGREIVGSKGLFLNAKKKYTIKVVNLDGFDLEKPKLKTVGSEMKKADTPKVIQDFLKDMMNMILDGAEYEEVEKFINTQRGVLVTAVKDPIALGVSKQINNLDAKYDEWQQLEKTGKGKVNLPGHVRAAVNYNEMVSQFDPGSKLLRSGDKGIIFYLRPNDFGFKSIALPADADRFPPWFLENFKVDRKLTEDKMIDAKLGRTFEALKWDIPTPQKTMVKSILKF